MTYPRIFDLFERVECCSDGRSIFDFLGGGIDASYKHDWEKNTLKEGVKFRPSYPPLSEWSVDWIASLIAAKIAGDSFTVVELGAGYGQWMVSAIMAFKSLNPEGQAYGLALEADNIHFDWLGKHVKKNLGPLQGIHTDLLYAAAGVDGIVEFPVLTNPSKEYGASYSVVNSESQMVEVDCFSLPSIYRKLPDNSVDLLHIDIQGAEVDLIKDPAFAETISRTRFIMFGTHRTDDLHRAVRESLENNGFSIKIDWPRNSKIETFFGTVKTNDGALFAVNKSVPFEEEFEKLCDLSLPV